MNVIATARPAASVPKPAEHFDVLIVGAGISGVGSAYHLTTQLPGTGFVILESQESFGGTWLTHRYPGIRSDSDLHTFGYRFKPWRSAPIATAAEILKYMGDVIEENDLSRHIRYQHTITSAKWSSVRLQGSSAPTRLSRNSSKPSMSPPMRARQTRACRRVRLRASSRSLMSLK